MGIFVDLPRKARALGGKDRMWPAGTIPGQSQGDKVAAGRFFFTSRLTMLNQHGIAVAEETVLHLNCFTIEFEQAFPAR